MWSHVHKTLYIKAEPDEHGQYTTEKLTRNCEDQPTLAANMREIVHIQAGQCGNQIGAKVSGFLSLSKLILPVSNVYSATMGDVWQFSPKNE